jgi:hypothetical protein
VTSEEGPQKTLRESGLLLIRGNLDPQNPCLSIPIVHPEKLHQTFELNKFILQLDVPPLITIPEIRFLEG